MVSNSLSITMKMNTLETKVNSLFFFYTNTCLKVLHSSIRLLIESLNLLIMMIRLITTITISEKKKRLSKIVTTGVVVSQRARMCACRVSFIRQMDKPIIPFPEMWMHQPFFSLKSFTKRYSSLNVITKTFTSIWWYQ